MVWLVKLALGLHKHPELWCSLHNSVFTTSDLILETKRMVYRSVVLVVLLYGAET